MWLAKLFPVECLGCREPPFRLCASCANRLIQPQALQPRTLNLGCSERPSLRLFEFRESGAAVIRAIKDHGETTLVKQLLGAATLARLDEFVCSVGASGMLLVAVPTTARSLKKRAFDVPSLMVNRIARASSLPAMVSRSVKLAFEPKDQRQLNTSQRAANLAGAFAVDLPMLVGELTRVCSNGGTPLILICDDVVTTGATMESIAGSIEAQFSAAGLRPPIVAVFALAETLLKSDPRSSPRVYGMNTFALNVPPGNEAQT